MSEVYERQIQQLQKELATVRDRLKAAENKANQPSPFVIELQKEMTNMKVQSFKSLSCHPLSDLLRSLVSQDPHFCSQMDANCLLLPECSQWQVFEEDSVGNEHKITTITIH